MVYIVESIDDDGSMVSGVFSSKEAADTYAESSAMLDDWERFYTVTPAEVLDEPPERIGKFIEFSGAIEGDDAYTENVDFTDTELSLEITDEIFHGTVPVIRGETHDELCGRIEDVVDNYRRTHCSALGDARDSQ